MTTVRATAPGRVNLIGEHTDYNGGLCLPIAIPLGTTATVTRRDDEAVHVTSDRAPEGSAWRQYVDGVVAELRTLGWAVPGLDIEVTSTLPLGGGLSSSAALECAVATAVAGLLGHELDSHLRRVLAEVARRAETLHVGAPTGGMDQLASMLGWPDHALLLDFADLERPGVTPVPCRPGAAGVVLLVTDTGVRHRLADGDGGYAQRRRECEAGDPRRWRHVRSENERVRAAAAAMEAGAWGRVGELMVASHVSLRDDFEVSCRELDLTVEAALAAGALGSRMTGGGFGGCTITVTHEGRVDAVRDGIDAAYEAAGLPRPVHHEVAPAEGARLT
ncbi:galactokinase [Nocardioides sp. J9]|uniref:galactokinase n=1 Tax=Nocardioides sp. J9 TaxID=935844 RepID=UPI0011ABCF0C|nr:galactokinase family protein [Nocardioides sp. J9]TWG95013.1 galactokinase [Nocardioides sp. J9]